MELKLRKAHHEVRIPERVAMNMTGLKTWSMFERYSIVSECDPTNVATRLDSFF